MQERDAAGPDRSWIRRVDDHAGSRLRLLDAAAAGPAPGGEAAVDLAERIERWRVQHLRERWSRDRSGRVAGLRSPRDRVLADALDSLARRLRGGPDRPPRWPRAFVDDGPPSAPPAMEAALDPRIPLWEVTAAARRLTRERFGAAGAGVGGWRVRLYAPLYLSSHCANRCAYCGFQAGLPLSRSHLEPAAALAQARVLAERGFRHLLLVAGDFPRLVTVDYLAGIAAALVERGLQPAVEVAALSTGGYARLAAAGVKGVTLYMETYDEAAYRRHHPRGPKVSFDWRLEALDRAAEAGIRRLGLGVLLGLAEPGPDLRALAAHAAMLSRRFPSARLSFSLPRLHAAPAGFAIPRPVADDEFVRFMAALRLGFPGAEIVLSTREAPELRERLAGICVTQLSAGSSTVPGGYDDVGGDNPDADGQFPVADDRAPADTAAWLGDLGHRISWSLGEAGRAPEESRR